MLNEDDELPDDEEEVLVYVEFDGSVASNSFSNEKLQLNMIGLDMEHPIMQVNGKFYEGTYQDAVGTYMFFEKDDNPHVDDPVFDTPPTLKYFAKTRKVLKMNRIFVELKNEMFGDSNNPECVPSMEIIEKSGIPPRYKEAALKSWEKLRDERTKALNDYLEKQRIREEKRSHGIEPDSASDDDNPFAVYKPQVEQKKSKNVENRSNSPLRENVKTHGFSENKDETFEKNDESAKIHKNISTFEEVSKNRDDEEITDPKPSTSKDSQPWHCPLTDDSRKSLSTSDFNDKTRRVKLPNVKGKHKATIQSTRRAKIRKKIVNKKRKKSVASRGKSNDERIDLDDENKAESCDMIDDGKSFEDSGKNEFKAKIIDEPTETLDSMKSLSISQSTEESTKQIDVTENMEKFESTIDRAKLDKQRKRDEKMRLIANKLKKAADELRLKKTSENNS